MRKILIIGTLTFFLVGAGTTMYAKSNTAQHVSEWYHSEFLEKSGVLGAVTASEMIKGLAGFKQFVAGSKISFAAVIGAFRDDSIRETQAEIEMQRAEIVKEIDETVVELQQDTFDDYVDKLNIEAEITKEVEEMVEELVNE